MLKGGLADAARPAPVAAGGCRRRCRRGAHLLQQRPQRRLGNLAQHDCRLELPQWCRWEGCCSNPSNAKAGPLDCCWIAQPLAAGDPSPEKRFASERRGQFNAAIQPARPAAPFALPPRAHSSLQAFQSSLTPCQAALRSTDPATTSGSACCCTSTPVDAPAAAGSPTGRTAAGGAPDGQPGPPAARRQQRRRRRRRRGREHGSSHAAAATGGGTTSQRDG